MTSLKPYLIRSIHEWLLDNELTPYLLVDASHPDAIIPKDYVDNGMIALNLRPAAIQGLELGNKDVQFSTCFSGKPMQITAPIAAILSIYAKENGEGMNFEPEDYPEKETLEVEKKPSKPHLSIIK